MTPADALRRFTARAHIRAAREQLRATTPTAAECDALLGEIDALRKAVLAKRDDARRQPR